MAIQNINNQNIRRLDLKEILEALKKSEMITQDECRDIYKEEYKTRNHPLLILAKYRIKDKRKEDAFLSMEDLSKWFASYCGKSYWSFDLKTVNFDMMLKVIPLSMLEKEKIIPIEIQDDKIIFAVLDPFKIDWIDEIQNKLSKKVFTRIANPEKIIECLQLITSKKLSTNFSNLMEKASQVISNGGKLAEIEGFVIDTKSKRNIADSDSNIIKMVNWFLKFADEERATDMHFEPKAETGILKFRIDGVLRMVYKFDLDIFWALINRIKIIAEMKVDEKRRPQDGRIKIKFNEEKEVDLRASTIPTYYGEKMVLRKFETQFKCKSFEDLGLFPEDIKRWKELIVRPFGLILVTGPTGSGKTTTLHTSLNYLAKPEINISTIEDPIEIVNPMLNQVQVKTQIDVTFANTIRAFLRQDPNIIMVGEIRDTETAEMAIQASLTGHLVLSTLHTNDAISTVSRLVDLGIPSFLLNSTLICIMSQRLIRVLCTHCKEQANVDENMWKSFIHPYDFPLPKTLYKAKGCPKCNETGYIDRVSVYEMLIYDDQIKNLIRPDTDLTRIKEQLKGKFVTIKMNGIRRVLEGMTTIDEVLKKTY
ncbi:MAG: type II/IV secretion system protein [Oligoflexia bacterium]|nr:type II/IV secretion system protein [Oligoflexia bacterium]